MNLNQVTLPAKEVQASVDFYVGMGFKLIVLALPRYARFECPEGDSTFSVHLVEGQASKTGCVVYFECSDLDDKVRRLLDAGYNFELHPTDQKWLWREARLLDPAGNELCLFNAGPNRRNPPWRIRD